jgi:DNA mismatch repair protein MutS
MMGQFEAAKREQPDCLLFFRMGDFYELFGEDAKIASRELGIALTSRDKGTNPLAMAGVPVRSVEGYLLKLVAKGHRVAICEQIGDPRTTKGIVERRIVRVVTAGTITEEDALEARQSNWLASLFVAPPSSRTPHASRPSQMVGLAWMDVSTGRFLATVIPLAGLEDELARIAPAEVLVSETVVQEGAELGERLRARLGGRLTERDAWRFERDAARRALHAQLGVASLEGFGIEDDSTVVPAAGALVEYLQETQRGACEHVKRIELVDATRHLVLD